jgi:uncharacterized damage-inducible protein DinB
MNSWLLALILLACPAPNPPAAPPPSLKTILLAQLKSTHDQQDWFVPASRAVEGLTAEQADWRDGNANHSIAQLVNHLVFWNQSQLASWKGEKGPAYGGRNDETFGGNLDRAAWENAVRELDAVLTDMEHWIEAADESSLQRQYDNIAHVSAHNAYHTGQILYIRKQQGSWDPEKGVK